MEDIGEQIRDVTIEAKEISKELERLWNLYYNLKFGKPTTQHLTCDSCKEKKNDIQV